MIQVALNGSRNEELVPKTTEQIVLSAISSVENGAESIHFHPRDDEGNETLEARFVDRQVGELRNLLEPIPIGISTGQWIEPDLKKRLKLITSWKTLPDFVSINYDESGYKLVTELISEKGIKIEAGLSDLASAINFTRCYKKEDFVRILIEPQEQTLKSAQKTVLKIENQLKRAGIRLPVLLHGSDKTCWDIIKMAFRKDYQTRIGFEDVLTLPDGTKAKTNAELLEQAFKIKSQLPTKAVRN